MKMKLFTLTETDIDEVNVPGLVPGLKVTVLESTDGDRSWQGDVLEVVAVSFPFVAVKNLSQSYIRNNVEIDLRERTLMTVSPEYAVAMTWKAR